MGRLKRKSALEHAQKSQTEVILCMWKISSASLLFILYYPTSLLADSEGPDQTVRMRRLIWAFTARIYPKTLFRIS